MLPLRGQSELRSDVSKGVLCIPLRPGITEGSLSDCLVSYLGHSLGKSYYPVEMQSVYSTAPRRSSFILFTHDFLKINSTIVLFSSVNPLNPQVPLFQYFPIAWRRCRILCIWVQRVDMFLDSVVIWFSIFNSFGGLSLSKFLCVWLLLK